MALEGQLLGHYRIVRLIGQGGMGEVYLAEDMRIARQVALKVVRSERQPYPDAEAVQQAERLFQREMKAVSRLDHPHILSFYDFGEQETIDGALVFMVMPYRPEGSLVTWLVQRGNDLLPTRDVALMIGQAASALQHAHDHQIVHQDVKPSNFLLRHSDEHPTRPDLYLVDFGIAKILSGTASASNSVRGTHIYMAPEQWSGDASPAADQYALAVMTYQLLTGQLPFKGRPEQIMYQHLTAAPTPPSTLQPRLSTAIDAVLLRALAKKPDERFPSIKAYATALLQAADYIDLRATLAITRSEAQQGGSRTVTLPGKRQEAVSIPAGVEHGQVLQFPQLGMPLYDGGPNGPLLLILSTAQTDVIPLTHFDDSKEPQTALIGGLPTEPANASPSQDIAPPYGPLFPGYPVPVQEQTEFVPPPSSAPIAPPQKRSSDRLAPASFSDQIVLEPPIIPSLPITPMPPLDPGPPRSDGRRRSPWRAVLFTLLALLLIGGGVLAVLAVNSNIAANNAHVTTQSMDDDNATGTAQVQATDNASTAQAQVQVTSDAVTAQAIAQATSDAVTAQAIAQATSDAATAQAIAQATSDAVTAQAIAQATSDAAVAQATQSAINNNPDPYGSGTLAFVDPLSKAGEWHDSSNSYGGQCQFSNSSYQASQINNQYIEVCSTYESYSNFAFEVKMSITQGDCGGLILRDNGQNTADYFFRVCQDGTYGFYRYNSTNTTTTLTSGSSSAINQGVGQTNVIAAVANGGNFTLYVNNQNIDSASDGNPYGQGSVSLVAEDISNSTVVSYRDARLWTF